MPGVWGVVVVPLFWTGGFSGPADGDVAIPGVPVPFPSPVPVPAVPIPIGVLPVVVLGADVPPDCANAIVGAAIKEKIVIIFLTFTTVSLGLPWKQTPRLRGSSSAQELPNRLGTLAIQVSRVALSQPFVIASAALRSLGFNLINRDRAALISFSVPDSAASLSATVVG